MQTKCKSTWQGVSRVDSSGSVNCTVTGQLGQFGLVDHGSWIVDAWPKSVNRSALVGRHPKSFQKDPAQFHLILVEACMAPIVH